MITPGRQYRFIGYVGKLASRCNQIVTVIKCQRAQILVRFPDGREANIQRRFLRQLPKP